MICHPHNRLRSLWDMHRIDGKALLDALETLASMDSIASQDPDWVYKSDRVQGMVRALNEVAEQLEILDARLALRVARRMLIGIQELNPKYDAKTVAAVTSKNLGELKARLVDELDDRAIYYVPPAQAQLVADAALSFGQRVVDSFPDMTTDLGEAAACLGLARNTACVFHLMRAVESAVSVIGQKLGVAIVDGNNVGLNWGLIIANLNRQIVTMAQGPEKDKWSEISAQLFHVKNCWRNKTMHPKQTYSDREATEIFSAVKSFLRSLAQEF